MTDRDLWLAVRRALLIVVKVIEERWPGRTVTVTLKREDAARLGLIESRQ